MPVRRLGSGVSRRGGAPLLGRMWLLRHHIWVFGRHRAGASRSRTQSARIQARYRLDSRRHASPTPGAGSASQITSTPRGRSVRSIVDRMEWEDPAEPARTTTTGARGVHPAPAHHAHRGWNLSPVEQPEHPDRRGAPLPAPPRRAVLRARPRPPDAAVFVDELDLPPRVESEPGGAPDWAVLSPHRLWLIELKTEAASHRPHQIPYYFQLGAHHFPEHSVDVTYVTGPLTKPAPQTGEDRRYAHLTWDAVIPLASETWGRDLRPEVGRSSTCSRMPSPRWTSRWADWRDVFTATTPPVTRAPGRERPPRAHRGHRGRRGAAGARLAGGVARAPSSPPDGGTPAHPRLARGKRDATRHAVDLEWRGAVNGQAADQGRRRERLRAPVLALHLARVLRGQLLTSTVLTGTGKAG